MKPVIIRSYHYEGTDGTFYIDGQLICYTIELPWKENKHSVSCIPEGRYALVKRYSSKFGDHLMLKDVPGRKFILMHPANNALKELRGCIAPVLSLNGHGKGINSRLAMKEVLQKIYSALDHEDVWLEIKNESFTIKEKKMKKLMNRINSDTPVFFKKLRGAGLVLAAVSTAILAGPAAIPIAMTKIAGYLAVAGGIMTAVSQTAIKNELR